MILCVYVALGRFHYLPHTECRNDRSRIRWILIWNTRPRHFRVRFTETFFTMNALVYIVCCLTCSWAPRIHLFVLVSMFTTISLTYTRYWLFDYSCQINGITHKQNKTLQITIEIKSMFPFFCACACISD